MSDGDWDIDPDSITLPNFADPNAAAIVIGPDLPPCMRGTYSSAQFYRPANTVTDGANGNPSWFVAQSLSVGGSVVDEGWLIYDQGAVCGYIVVKRRSVGNFGGGSLLANETWGDIASVGAASVNTAVVQQVGSNPGRAPASFNIGNQFNFSPKLSPFNIDTRSAPRGLVGFQALAVSSGFTVAGAELAVITSVNSITFWDSRAYLIEFEGDVDSTVANGFATVQIRRTNITGPILRQAAGYGMPSVGGFGQTCKGSALVRNISGADITDILLLTIQPFIGGQVRMNAGPNRLCYIRTTDIGSATDYVNGTAL